MKKVLTFLLTIIAIANVHAQNGLQTDMPLRYMLKLPAKTSNASPMILLLHGYGSNEADLFELKDQLPADFIVIAARAPLTVSADAYQWFRMETVNGNMQGNPDDLKTSSEAIKSFIKAAIKRYHADPSQVYLCGFSQGAMMSYEVGLTTPELLKGIAPLSGKIFESLKPQIKPSASLSRLRVFIGHGEADNRVPYHFAVDAKNYLITLKMPIVFYSFKNMQHSINAREIEDLSNWLQGK